MELTQGGTWDSLLQYLYLDKHLPEQQIQRNNRGTKNNCVMCSGDELWTCWEPGFQAWAQSTCPELSAQGPVPLRA